MATSKSKRRSGPESAPAQEGLLTTAARTVGHAAGEAAKAIGIDHADSGVDAEAEPKIGPAKTSKRLSARARRKNQAEEAKSAAEKFLSKGAADLGAPYRRVMGKPAANWTAKEIEYINGLVAKQNA